jgi:N-acetylglucosamine-6-phosphate deacetylase
MQRLPSSLDFVSADFLPIDFHCHGVGSFDFGRPRDVSLIEINTILRQRHQRAILTLFLERDMLPDLASLCQQFLTLFEKGETTHILGLAIEGPLTSSTGGTPSRCHWAPTSEQWAFLASLGNMGLRYIVVSPDANPNPNALHNLPSSIEWVIETLLDGSVSPALGHFSKQAPTRSADSVFDVLDIVRKREQGPIFTDHLFNDMPLVCKHAWRTAEDLSRRDSDLLDIDLSSWNRTNLSSCLGPVPAAIIEGAFAGLLRISLNFDGAHVDLAICKRIVEIVESRRVMLMTDSIPGKIIAGTHLLGSNLSPLLRQPDGIVAGSSADAWEQVANMVSMDFSEEDIFWLCQGTAERALSEKNNLRRGKHGC